MEPSSFHTALKGVVSTEVTLMNEYVPSKYSSTDALNRYETLKTNCVNAASNLKGEINVLVDAKYGYVDRLTDDFLEYMKANNTAIDDMLRLLHDHIDDTDRRLDAIEEEANRRAKRSGDICQQVLLLCLVYMYIYMAFLNRPTYNTWIYDRLGQVNGYLMG